MFNGRKLSALDVVDAAQTPTLSRRQFLLGATLIGSALMVGCRMESSGDAAPAAAAGGKPAAGSPFEAYIAIAANGIVTVYSSQFDMGQNSYHGLATLVAEELDVALDNVRDRLNLLHDMQSQFQATFKDGLYLVRIEIPV